MVCGKVFSVGSWETELFRKMVMLSWFTKPRAEEAVVALWIWG